MKSMYPADNIGKDGTAYPTIGEHIRNNVVTAKDIADAIVDNTDRAKVCDKLDVTAEVLKLALVALLTGRTSHFGGLDVDKLTSDELSNIKEYLGIV